MLDLGTVQAYDCAAPAPTIGVPLVCCGQKGQFMRLLLIDADGEARSALAAHLRALAAVEVIGEAEDGMFAVALAQVMQPDVILMALAMPIVNGIAAARRLQADCPNIRVVGLVKQERAEDVQAMLDAGAIACVRTEAGLDTLLAALVRQHQKTR